MPDFDVVPIVKVGPCQLYRPGHAAHFIQARVCWVPERVREVELVLVESAAIVVRDGDKIERLLHHHVDDIREFLAGGGSIHLTSDDTLLTLGIGGGHISFSVKPDDGEPLEPCSP